MVDVDGDEHQLRIFGLKSVSSVWITRKTVAVQITSRDEGVLWREVVLIWRGIFRLRLDIAFLPFLYSLFLPCCSWRTSFSLSDLHTTRSNLRILYRLNWHELVTNCAILFHKRLAWGLHVTNIMQQYHLVTICHLGITSILVALSHQTLRVSGIRAQ